MCYLKSYVPELVIITHAKPHALSCISFNLLSLRNSLFQEKTGFAKIGQKKDTYQVL